MNSDVKKWVKVKWEEVLGPMCTLTIDIRIGVSLNERHGVVSLVLLFGICVFIKETGGRSHKMIDSCRLTVASLVLLFLICVSIQETGGETHKMVDTDMVSFR